MPFGDHRLDDDRSFRTSRFADVAWSERYRATANSLDPEHDEDSGSAIGWRATRIHLFFGILVVLDLLSLFSEILKLIGDTVRYAALLSIACSWLALMPAAVLARPDAPAGNGEVARKTQRFVGSCLPQDENGRDLPNPNASSVCGQFRDGRSECAMQERLGNRRALALHCFGFDDVADAEPAEAPARYTSGPRR